MKVKIVLYLFFRWLYFMMNKYSIDKFIYDDGNVLKIKYFF